MVITRLLTAPCSQISPEYREHGRRARESSKTAVESLFVDPERLGADTFKIHRQCGSQPIQRRPAPNLPRQTEPVAVRIAQFTQKFSGNVATKNQTSDIQSELDHVPSLRNVWLDGVPAVDPIDDRGSGCSRRPSLTGPRSLEASFRAFGTARIRGVTRPDSPTDPARFRTPRVPPLSEPLRSDTTGAGPANGGLRYRHVGCCT
jgi:hypothetical protein